MSDFVKIRVLGLPVAQPRVKACIRGAHAGVYTPGTADLWKAQVSQAVAAQVGAPLGEGVSLGLEFYLPRPKGHYRTGKHASQLRPDAPRRPTRKPDIDNLVKAVLDALRGIAWTDDCQVVTLTTSKRWADDTPTGLVLEMREE